jgi:hypothetical protein
MKRCFKCGEVKDLSAFYAHKRMADGHLNKCMECTKADTKRHYRDHIDEYRTYRRDYSKRPQARARRVAQVQRARAERDPKRLARDAVSNAIRDGHLTPRPCEVCGCTPAQAHHDDYSRPLDVQWLCFKHHRIRHGQLAHTG